MILRCTFLAGLSASFAERALAQQLPLRRIGWLRPRSERTVRGLDVFRRGLEQTGCVEGRDLVPPSLLARAEEVIE